MRPELAAVLDPLLAGAAPPPGAVRGAIQALMNGDCQDVEIAALLTAIALRGEREEDLAEAASVMRERATRVTTRRQGLLDTCGTGGDRLHTFNISTAAAIVAAAAGVPVAKHGNRHASSCSGSADVLEALGVNIQLTAEQAGRCIDEVGIGFCFARLLHQAMKHVAAVRSALGFRTIFNMLGPLSNPAGADFQLIGASRIETARRLAGAVSRLGVKRALVVCGNDQLDEVALWGTTQGYDVRDGAIAEFRWTAADLGLPECSPDELRVDSPAASAERIREVLKGRPGASRNIVIANAAAALLTAGRASSIREGAALATDVIDRGEALRTLEALATWTRSAGGEAE
ncbi:MAG: anthranilate phosphoribosyltransferase [Planctomyces sp.]|nr:anthranilate phosphoribosyltransferase [Planctomyces sp.]